MRLHRRTAGITWGCPNGTTLKLRGICRGQRGTPDSAFRLVSRCFHRPSAGGIIGGSALVIHNEGDRSTPFAISREFISRRPELATLLTFPSAEHTQEWNSDPDGWDAAVENWLRNVPPSSSMSL